MELLHAIDFSQVLWHADSKLLDVIFSGIFLIEHPTEEHYQVLIFWNQSGRRRDGFYISMNTKFHPFDPHMFIPDGVDEIALLVSQEVVNTKNQRQFFQAVGKLQIVPNILAP